MFDRQCKHCGAGFNWLTPPQKYCSKDCARAYVRERDRHRHYVKRVLANSHSKTCKGCGTLFVAVRATKKFCTKDCHYAYVLRKAKVPDVSRHCIICRAAYSNARVHKLTCSLACAKVHEQARHKRIDVSISSRIRSRMRAAMRMSKNGMSWETLVGYSLAELMAYLESKFVDGMSWQNAGDWHIDHIRPLSSFKIVDTACADFRVAWSLSNLQPLWAVDNMRKGSKYVIPEKA